MLILDKPYCQINFSQSNRTKNSHFMVENLTKSFKKTPFFDHGTRSKATDQSSISMAEMAE